MSKNFPNSIKTRNLQNPDAKHQKQKNHKEMHTEACHKLLKTKPKKQPFCFAFSM